MLTLLMLTLLVLTLLVLTLLVLTLLVLTLPVLTLPVLCRQGRPPRGRVYDVDVSLPLCRQRHRRGMLQTWRLA